MPIHSTDVDQATQDKRALDNLKEMENLGAEKARTEREFFDRMQKVKADRAKATAVPAATPGDEDDE